MSMKKILLAGVAATCMAGGTVAAEPVALNDAQLDNVTGGVFSAVISGGLIGPSGGIGEAVSGSTLTQFATVDQFTAAPDGSALATFTAASAQNDIVLRSISGTAGGVGSLGNISFAGFIAVP